jgi:EAL domain-containing protein (putative c-di-GMP-specific phosphodiesterase class I)
MQKNNRDISIELSHYALNQFSDVASHVADLTRNLGHGFGIDHFDLGSDLSLVGEIRPDYIKIDAHQLDDITADNSVDVFTTLRAIAKTHDILLIAVSIDTPELLQRMHQLGDVGLQGNQLSQPRKL